MKGGNVGGYDGRQQQMQMDYGAAPMNGGYGAHQFGGGEDYGMPQDMHHEGIAA